MNSLLPGLLDCVSFGYLAFGDRDLYVCCDVRKSHGCLSAHWVP